MYTFVKSLLPSPLHAWLRDVKKQFRNFAILAREYGQYSTIRQQVPVDAKGAPIPWYSYPALEYLKQLDLRDKTVFEWGSGHSSLWWASRAKTVYSVEDNPTWFEMISKRKLPNQEITLVQDKQEYINHLKTLNRKFDIIVIDGHTYRGECAQVAPDYLSENGVLILDNSDWFFRASLALKKRDFIQVDFAGFGPINAYVSVTSLFFTRKFDFPSHKEIQPQHVIGGLPWQVED